MWVVWSEISCRFVGFYWSTWVVEGYLTHLLLTYLPMKRSVKQADTWDPILTQILVQHSFPSEFVVGLFFIRDQNDFNNCFVHIREQYHHFSSVFLQDVVWHLDTINRFNYTCFARWNFSVLFGSVDSVKKSSISEREGCKCTQIFFQLICFYASTFFILRLKRN